MRHASWLLPLLLLTSGCGDEDEAQAPSHALVAPTEKPARWPSAEARRLAPDRCPAPYTAEQIRSGCFDGRVAVFRMQVGGNEVLQRWRFEKGDAEGVTWSNQSLGPDGKPLGEPRARRVTWASLQGHASYPAKATQVAEETIEVPAGTFACMCYTVTTSRSATRKVDGKDVTTPEESVARYWFAWALPGPPVKTEERVDGELVSTMELVEHGVERKR